MHTNTYTCIPHRNAHTHNGDTFTHTLSLTLLFVSAFSYCFCMFFIPCDHAAALKLIVTGKNPDMQRKYVINQETVFEEVPYSTLINHDVMR